MLQPTSLLWLIPSMYHRTLLISPSADDTQVQA